MGGAASARGTGDLRGELTAAPHGWRPRKTTRGRRRCRPVGGHGGASRDGSGDAARMGATRAPRQTRMPAMEALGRRRRRRGVARVAPSTGSKPTEPRRAQGEPRPGEERPWSGEARARRVLSRAPTAAKLDLSFPAYIPPTPCTGDRGTGEERAGCRVREERMECRGEMSSAASFWFLSRVVTRGWVFTTVKCR